MALNPVLQWHWEQAFLFIYSTSTKTSPNFLQAWYLGPAFEPEPRLVSPLGRSIWSRLRREMNQMAALIKSFYSRRLSQGVRDIYRRQLATKPYRVLAIGISWQKLRRKFFEIIFKRKRHILKHFFGTWHVFDIIARFFDAVKQRPKLSG